MDPQPSNGVLEVERREDVLIARFTCPAVSLCGELAQEVGDRFVSLLSGTGPQRLLVDFGNVHDLTSFMLGQLVRVNRTAQAAGRQFALFNLQPPVREVLEVSRLNLLLTLCEDEPAAMHCG
jgi:anti-anti-sigma regulatory factor